MNIFQFLINLFLIYLVYTLNNHTNNCSPCVNKCDNYIVNATEAINKVLQSLNFPSLNSRCNKDNTVIELWFEYIIMAKIHINDALNNDYITKVANEIPKKFISLNTYHDNITKQFIGFQKKYKNIYKVFVNKFVEKYDNLYNYSLIAPRVIANDIIETYTININYCTEGQKKICRFTIYASSNIINNILYKYIVSEINLSPLITIRSFYSKDIYWRYYADQQQPVNME